tara:strand:- start:145 stop:495 length:351 start_codon:yes stop_codon:yes gene_type:complete
MVQVQRLRLHVQQVHTILILLQLVLLLAQLLLQDIMWQIIVGPNYSLMATSQLLRDKVTHASSSMMGQSVVGGTISMANSETEQQIIESHLLRRLALALEGLLLRYPQDCGTHAQS